MPTSVSISDAIASKLRDVVTLDNQSAIAQQKRAFTDGAALAGQSQSLPRAKPSARRRMGSSKLKKRTKRPLPPAKSRKPRTMGLHRKTSSKAQMVIELLSRSRGVSIAKIMKATRWQAHSVRGFLSARVKRRMGLALTSERTDGKDRRYRIICE